MIIKMLSLGELRTNCYLVGSETTGEGVIIDPASDPLAILDEVRRLGLKIDLLVNTHGHVDHFMALESVKHATGARLRFTPTTCACCLEPRLWNADSQHAGVSYHGDRSAERS